MIPIRLKNILQTLRSYDWIQELMSISEVFVVGGPVRDSFRNADIKDIDLIIVGLTPQEILQVLRPFGKAGIEGESFAVIKFSPKFYEGEAFDIAVPRIDRKTGDGHKDFDVEIEGVSLEKDLERRDFTINAMAANVRTGEIIDPFNGLNDLKNKILRAVDITAFSDDALRILRGIQFASRFGFSIDGKTLELMKNNSHLIKHIKGERIFDELMKILKKSGDTQLALDLIHETDADKALFDKKMLRYKEGFNHLDPASFFYILGLLGDVDPGDFVKKRLKSDSNTEKNVKTLDRIFSAISKISDEEDLRYMLSKSFTAAPDIMNSVILPKKVDKISQLMQSGIIPISVNDIAADGKDIMALGGFGEGPKVGIFTNRMLRDALMNRFDWTDREKSLSYLDNIINLKT